ncbi:MAG: hypothetical protein RIB67_02520 [Miltoncostaeaceae bacterium]
MDSSYAPWLADFERRLAQHDRGVDSLANDLAARTDWRVYSALTEGLPAPPETIQGAPDVLCSRGPTSAPMWFEVELPETLVRRETVARLRRLALHERVEVRLAVVAPAERHEREIPDARRILMRAGMPLDVLAIDPDAGMITGADW